MAKEVKEFLLSKIERIMESAERRFFRFLKETRKKIMMGIMSMMIYSLALIFILAGTLVLISKVVPWEYALIGFGIVLLMVGIVVNQQ